MRRSDSPSSDRVARQSLTPKLNIPSAPTNDPSLLRRRSLKGSRSAENLRSLAAASAKPASRANEAHRKPTNDSSLNLATASPPTVTATHAQRSGSETLADKRPADRRSHAQAEVTPPVRHNSFGTVSDQIMSPAGPPSAPVPVPRSPRSPLIPASERTSEARAPSSPVCQLPPSPLVSAPVRTSDERIPPPPSPAGTTASGTKKVHRRSPPPPPKRRKPPAVPIRVVGKSNSGADIAAIASSTLPPASSK